MPSSVRVIGIFDVCLDNWFIVGNVVRITSKTRAIMPVHLYGVPVDMSAVVNCSCIWYRCN